jgi:serine phosphatase RsbU (regulator of sigma subunit)
VLALTDEYLHHFDEDKLATAVCAALRPPFDEVVLSSAGHPPPVLALPDDAAALVELPTAPPLGFQYEDRRPSSRLALPPGAVLLLYTDGLVDRRHESIEVRFKQLSAAVTADEPLAVCHRVMGLLVGADQAEDDIAILAMRRTPEPGQPSDRRALEGG